MENNNDIVKNYLADRRRKWTRYLTGIAVALMTLLTTYLVHTHPSLNLADLTNAGPSGNLTHKIYMPNYSGGIGEVGQLEIKTKDALPSFDSITFSLHYSPVNALLFENNPIVFDSGTKFQDAAFQMTASPEDGKLIVTIVLDESNPITTANDGITPIDVSTEATHPTLFKLNTQLNPAMPEGQVIDISFEDFAVLDGVNPVTTPSMPAATITVEGQNELRVLNAKALDATHVAVTFSDYLSDMGSGSSYDLTPALTVDAVESGTLYGFDQRTSVLILNSGTPLVAGTEYVITINPTTDIESNQQGSVDSNYSNVVFYGYGSGTAVLSDFGMTGASVSGYTTITASFTDNVQAASVTKDDFSLNIQGGGSVAISNVSSVSGNQVTLSVATPLLKDNTYLLSAVSANAILRASDGASLGVRQVAFAGAKNGPRLISVNVSSVSGTYQAQLTFDENIVINGMASNAVGQVFNTDGTLITANGQNDINTTSSATWHQAISGATLTIENPVFGNADENYIFSVSTPQWLQNSLGVPVDDTYKSISFWGYGHNNSTNSVGTVSVDKKDTIIVPAGTLDFSQVVLADVSVNYINAPDTISSETVSSVSISGSNLEVVMLNPLDPDRHYTLRIVDNTSANNTLAAKDFAVKRELSITSAQALSANQLRVFFSENIDERDVVNTDFQINDAANITALTIDPGYQSVTLTTSVNLAPATATVFKVALNTPDNVWSYQGDYALQRAAYFTGYGTVAAKSPVKLSSVQVTDAQTLRLTFSGAVNATSFTPVNHDIFYFLNPADPSDRGDLVVSAVNQINSTTFELKTAVQQADKNYFIIFSGVKDSNGLLLANESPSNFFGYTLPKATINLVTPSVTDNAQSTNIVISGKNLDMVEEVRVGNQVMNIVSQTSGSLVFTVPASFPASLYNINLIDSADNSLVFKNALLVTVPEQELEVISAQSQAIPLNVPNDGITQTTLWLLVKDPVGLSSVSSVTVDLSQIGGPGVVEMTKSTGAQPQYSQWYTYTTTVPSTVATKADPYLLPAEVRKGSDIYTGTVSIRVTKDVVQSVPPVIENAYVSPVSVAPDNTTPVRISARISDADGAHTINSVIADLGSAGIGFITLSPVSEITEGTELETQFYQSEEFTIPLATDNGSYPIKIVASDITGESAETEIPFVVSTSANGPIISSDLSYVSPRKSIPNDGKTTFDLNIFVSDVDGAATIHDVTANLGSIGLSPVRLSPDTDASAAGGFTAWYKATGLTIPKTAPLGVHDIPVIATDIAGGVGSLILRIEVTHKDTLGDPPRVVEDRAYTTPRVAVNDGETPITLYAFIRDDDDDIESVIVNLAEIGQVGSQTGGVMGDNTVAEPSDGSCPTGSNVLVCMNPSVKEGDAGQWFILPNVTISKTTTPSPNPYNVEIIATDSGRKTTRGTIPVYVGTGDSVSDQQEVPRALAVIPTSETTVEVLFNKELSASSVLASGKGFTITGSGSTSDSLGIFGATINPAGNVVTLSTANQEPAKGYVLSVSNLIKDLVGQSVQEGAANRLSFSGFKAIGRAPVIEYINATNYDTLEVEFRDNLKPSSVRMGMTDLPGSSQFGVQVYESDNTVERLDILGVTLLSPGNVMQIKTSAQKPDMKYRLNLEGLESFDGTKVLSSINKGFKGYNLTLVQHLSAANFADLNSDGRVDFSDFTIFSSVYGTIYFGQGQNAEEQAAAAGYGQPIQENPDATVPITSEPAGGQIQ